MRVFDYDDYNWREGICIEVDSEAAETIADCLKAEIKRAANAEDYNRVSEIIASLDVLTDAIADQKAKEERAAKKEEEDEVDSSDGETAGTV